MTEFRHRLAVLVGIDEYDHYAPLPCVRADILGAPGRPGLKHVLREEMGAHSFNDIRELVGRHTYEDVSNTLRHAFLRIRQNHDTPDTLLLLYFSGHGVTDEFSDEHPLLIATSDTELRAPTRGIRIDNLAKQIAEIQATVVCVIDSCYGGAATATMSRHLATKTNFAVLTSSGNTEESYFAPNSPQSLFTHIIIDALRGREPSAIARREITAESLARCLSQRLANSAQTPAMLFGSVPIVLARPGVPIAVAASSDDATSRFVPYIESRLQEYRDHPELTSDAYYIRSLARHYVWDSGESTFTGADVFLAPTIDVLEQWSRDTAASVLLLMGDTGTGKTTVLRRFWYREAQAWLKDPTRPIPVLFNLRLLSGVRLAAGLRIDPGATSADDLLFSEINRRFRAVMTDALQNREAIPIFWSQFSQLARDGRLLLILDGLDEMDSEGLPAAAATHLALIMQLVGTGAKLIVSCRAHYIRSEAELRAALTGVSPDVAVHRLDAQPFTEEQVAIFLKGRLSPENLELWHRVRQDDKLHLTDLCARPFLVAELVKHFDEVVQGTKISPAKLFLRYLLTWLERDDWRFERFLNDFYDAIERDRSRLEPHATDEVERTDLTRWDHRVIASFIEVLAARLWESDAVSIPAERIPVIIRSYVPSAPDVFVSFFDYAIRTCSFLVRDGDDAYTFIDQSVLEYFAVRKIRGDILNVYHPWDTARRRGYAPVPRFPSELGRQRLTSRMADILADALSADRDVALRRLREFINDYADRVKASPETLYYLGGNCVAIYARLTGYSLIGASALDLSNKWLNGAQLAGVNLSNLDLSHSLLHQANLEGAVLRKTKLYGVQLVECQMQGVDLADSEINGDKDAIVRPSDGYDPTRVATPERIKEVFRLSNTKGKDRRAFRRPHQPLGEMQEIPGGTFEMGTDTGWAEPYERPARLVRVRRFFLDERPVTNAQFALFVRQNPEWRKDAVIDRFGIPYYLCYWNDEEPPKGKEGHPVVYVNWFAAAAYAQWLGKRLPTEAEWEFALRDGNHDERFTYPYGPTPETGINEYVRRQSYEMRTASPGEQPTLDVSGNVHAGRIQRNYKLIDMNGNVNEWVSDWFAEDFQYFERLRDATKAAGAHYHDDDGGPTAGVRKVIRGGSYLVPPDVRWQPFTTFYRRPLPPANTNQDCGFRCALSVEARRQREYEVGGV